MIPEGLYGNLIDKQLEHRVETLERLVEILQKENKELKRIIRESVRTTDSDKYRELVDKFIVEK